VADLADSEAARLDLDRSKGAETGRPGYRREELAVGAVPERRTAAVEALRALVEVQGRGFLHCPVKGQTVLSERRTVAAEALRALVEVQ
jgi:hypothetical protein